MLGCGPEVISLSQLALLSPSAGLLAFPHLSSVAFWNIPLSLFLLPSVPIHFPVGFVKALPVIFVYSRFSDLVFL